MADHFNVCDGKAHTVAADERTPRKILNARGGILFYNRSPDFEPCDGQGSYLANGESVTVKDRVWLRAIEGDEVAVIVEP